MVLGLTSAAGILALLDEPTDDLKVFALQKLNAIVDDFWAEISDYISKIEILQEDEQFSNRQLAALVVSKVYYHLGEFDDSLTFALLAGTEFEVNDPKSLYVQTMIGKAIDKYTELRVQMVDNKDISVKFDAGLEAIVNRMFDRCFKSKTYRQALGIALESRRMDIVEKALVQSGDLESMLAYCFGVVLTLIRCLDFRNAVIHVLAKLFRELPNSDHFSICQCYIALDNSQPVADILHDLLSNDQTPMAYQIAFDLYEGATQRFLANVRRDLSAKTSAAAPAGDMDTADDKVNGDAGAPALDAELVGKVNSILSGELTLAFNVEFLSRKNNTDKLILQTTKDAIQRNSICHAATVVANSFMYAGTTSDEFLRENVEWLGRATNWAKFSAVASLGVIHKGHTGEARNVLSPYLPKPDVAGSPYEKGGSLYALGLVHANHGADVTDYLVQHLAAEGTTEVVQHGGCLGLGLAAMASQKKDVYESLKGVLYSDSALAGEAAGMAMGLVMLGSADAGAIQDMTAYAQDTQHEKIIRGLALGVALTMYNRQEEADGLIAQLEHDKDALLRTSACFTIAMAYIGTGNNGVIRKLLHTAVSDVNDDVRRAAVTSIGFVLLRNPQHVPSVVSLLSESFNPHVRFGSCMALGISCASTGLKEAIALVEPMTTDPVPFVRQGALVALALIMMQAPNSHPKSESLRKLYVKVISDKHEDVLAKMGAIYGQGILDAGGRNVSISLARESGHIHMPSAVGLLVFTQFWFWYPLAHFLSLAFCPTAVVCLNEDLKMPRIEIMSNAAPSAFAYPPKTEPPKEKSKEKVATAILSTTSKAKAKAAKKRESVDANAMDVDQAKEAAAKKEKEKADAEDKKMEEGSNEATKEEGPEPEFEMLENPARVVTAQLEKMTYPADCRYRPVRSGTLKSGITILIDTKPGEAEELIELKPPSSAVTEDTSAEPEPPAPFTFNPDVENEEK